MTAVEEITERKTEERRQSSRKRTLLGGKIITNNYCSLIECSIRNTSDTGCQLQVHSQIGIPDDFEMRVSNGQSYQCQVVWRKDDRIGLRFVKSL